MIEVVYYIGVGGLGIRFGDIWIVFVGFVLFVLFCF